MHINYSIVEDSNADLRVILKGMSCERACDVRVHAKSILKSVRDVRAWGSFWGVRFHPKLCNQVPYLSLSRWRTLTLLKI